MIDSGGMVYNMKGMKNGGNDTLTLWRRSSNLLKSSAPSISRWKITSRTVKSQSDVFLDPPIS